MWLEFLLAIPVTLVVLPISASPNANLGGEILFLIIGVLMLLAAWEVYREPIDWTR